MKLIATISLFFIGSVVFAQNFNWVEQISGISHGLNDVYFVDDQNGWAVGDNGVIVSTADGGQNWNVQSSSVTEVLRSVFFIDDTIGWAVGGLSNKALIKTTDGGQLWQDITNSNFNSTIMYDIAFADPNSGWLITNDSIYITSDGGVTWTKEEYYNVNGPLANRSIAVTSDSIAYVAGIRNYPASSKTAEVFYRRLLTAPQLWNPSHSNSFDDNDALMSIAFATDSVGFVGGEVGKIYKTTGSHPGSAWTESLDLNPSGTQRIYGISFPTSNRGMIGTSVQIESTTYALVFHTTDQGNSWSETPDSIPNLFIASISAPDSSNAWVVGLNGKIFKGSLIPTSLRVLNDNSNTRIYPNPTSSFLNIEINSDGSEPVIYTVRDFTGKEITMGSWSSSVTGATHSLDLTDFESGFYLLSLRISGKHYTYKVIKE